MTGFFRGLRIPFEALSLIARHPRLWLWSLIPMAATVLLYAFLLQSLSHWLFPVLTADPTFWQQVLHVGFWILGLGVAAVTFSAFAQVLSTPVNDLLAESAEGLMKPALPPAPVTGTRGFFRRIKLDFLRSLLALVVTVVVAVSGLIPIGVHLPILFLLQAQVITFNALAYPSTRREQPVRATLALQRRNFGVCLGFGTVILLALPIPILNLLVIPVSVVGGNLLFGIALEAEPAR